ncbi:hypothetical protein RJ639_039851 [Escallonia herrerae]|uniref:EF-hand domain-containing protein n=1 Tax=Escallonia herrerae TaxID=1293975 RepID=A0AA89B8A0_9ASTE|nr:hypothetical protein RJ639_039851 [Escallonia herrerae]
MGKLARTACSTLFLLSLLAVDVTGRALRQDSSESVSDGIGHAGAGESSFLRLKSMDSAEEECEQMYGFLPCSNTLLGHLFLVLVYEYLMIHGESYVAAGGERIFKILGPGVFGASAFQVLGALPESLILLASGLSNSKELAQEYVFTGVGLLAGSTILVLTVIWGTCVIAGRRDFPSSLTSPSPRGSNPTQSRIKKLLSPLTDAGIITDMETSTTEKNKETSTTARIMALSVVPFIIILVPKIFHLSYSLQRITIIFALCVSLVFLILYFIYQVFQPWVQERRLEYIKHEHLVVDVLTHVQQQTMGRLLTEDGAPNVPAIRRLFQEVDQDGDNYISFSELKELLQEIRFRKSHRDQDETIAEVMKEFDLNCDKKITTDEFVTVLTKWIDDTKRAMDKRYHTVRSLKDLYQLAKIRSIFEYVRIVMASTLTNGPTGLQIPWDVDEIVAKVMEEFDVNGDQIINEDEFVSGFAKWLNTTSNLAPNSGEDEDDMFQKKWEEIDKLVEEKTIGMSIWAWTKAIALLMLGVIILAVLAEPLIDSVQNFSSTASVPSFFVSFILVPLATNARVAISAIKSARRKKPRTTSLTFSELYGGVFMNNVLGFSVLLSLVYFRGFSWDFSAEVLVVLMVSATVGLSASFCSTFPVWTSIVVFLLYPLSLLLAQGNRSKFCHKQIDITILHRAEDYKETNACVDASLAL